MIQLAGVVWHNAVKLMISTADQTRDEDCAKSVLFFVSDYSKVISGASIDINGGEYMAS